MTLAINFVPSDIDPTPTVPIGEWDNTLPTAVIHGLTHNCQMEKYSGFVKLINQTAELEGKKGVFAECIEIFPADPGLSSLIISSAKQGQDYCKLI